MYKHLEDLVSRYNRINKSLKKRTSLFRSRLRGYPLNNKDQELRNEIDSLSCNLDDLEDMLLEELKTNTQMNKTISIKVGDYRVIASIVLENIQIKKVKK